MAILSNDLLYLRNIKNKKEIEVNGNTLLGTWNVRRHKKYDLQKFWGCFYFIRVQVDRGANKQGANGKILNQRKSCKYKTHRGAITQRDLICSVHAEYELVFL